MNLAAVEKREIKATAFSFLFVFALMAAYYIMRPIRDGMSSDWSDVELSWLWTGTMLVSFIAVSIYGWVVSRIAFRLLVPSLYGFFALTFLCFYGANYLLINPVLADKAFYIWLSVFNLFHVSVFWSFMSELFDREQAPRLFGYIAAGSSIGALVGPLIPLLFANKLGLNNLMLLASVMLLIPIPLILALENIKSGRLGTGVLRQDISRGQTIGGSPLQGFRTFIGSQYLIAIAVFIILYASIGSFVYFELKNLLADYDISQRLKIWAGIDLAVNALAILTAMLATSRLTVRFGLGVTLAMVPVIVSGGLAILPLTWIVVALQVVRRAGNYAITRPAREVLFTAVDRESRFKAKPVIDILAYRGGDMLSGWAFTGLTHGFGLGLGPVAMIGGCIAIIWAVVGLALGKVFIRDLGVLESRLESQVHTETVRFEQKRLG
jgi:AAA family ATP:ADP antiporter